LLFSNLGQNKITTVPEDLGNIENLKKLLVKLVKHNEKFNKINK